MVYSFPGSRRGIEAGDETLFNVASFPSLILGNRLPRLLRSLHFTSAMPMKVREGRKQVRRYFPKSKSEMKKRKCAAGDSSWNNGYRTAFTLKMKHGVGIFIPTWRNQPTNQIHTFNTALALFLISSVNSTDTAECFSLQSTQPEEAMCCRIS